MFWFGLRKENRKLNNLMEELSGEVKQQGAYIKQLRCDHEEFEYSNPRYYWEVSIYSKICSDCGKEICKFYSEEDMLEDKIKELKKRQEHWVETIQKEEKIKIKEEKIKIIDELGLDEEDKTSLLKLLTNISFFNVQDLFNKDGSMKRIEDFPPESFSSIESIEFGENGEVLSVSTTGFKKAALNILVDYIGSFNEELNNENN